MEREERLQGIWPRRSSTEKLGNTEWEEQNLDKHFLVKNTFIGIYGETPYKSTKAEIEAFGHFACE